MNSRAPISAMVRCSPSAARTSASRAEMPTSGRCPLIGHVQIVHVAGRMTQELARAISARACVCTTPTEWSLRVEVEDVLRRAGLASAGVHFNRAHTRYHGNSVLVAFAYCVTSAPEFSTEPRSRALWASQGESGSVRFWTRNPPSRPTAAAAGGVPPRRRRTSCNLAAG